MIPPLILITLLVSLATGISAITGFGTSTISIPLLLSFFPFTQTILFVGIIHFAGTIWKMALFKRGFSCKLLITFGLPAAGASFLGACTLFSLSPHIGSMLLGLFLILYVSLYALHPHFKLVQNTTTTVVGGLLSGFFAGIFGLGGAIRSTFLHTFNLDKQTYLFTMNFIAFIIDVVRLTTYMAGDIYLSPLLSWSLVVTIPFSFLCAWLAKKIVMCIPQERFRLIVGICLGLAGIRLLFFPPSG